MPIFQGSMPKMAAFDLDYTLWPRDCDKDVLCPFTRIPHTDAIYDRYGRDASPYRHVGSIIGGLLDAGVQIAYLSRNPSADCIEELLRLCPLKSQKYPEKTSLWDALISRDYFHAYSSGNGQGKSRHFGSLKEKTGINFSEIVFFDDLYENIHAATAQGTTAVLVNRISGLTWSVVEEGLRRWR